MIAEQHVALPEAEFHGGTGDEAQTPEAIQSAIDEIAKERQAASSRGLVCYGLDEAFELHAAAMNIADREFIRTIKGNRCPDPVGDCGSRAHHGLLLKICLSDSDTLSKELV